MKQTNQQTTHKPLVSVIMPVKNAAEFVVQALQSIQAQTLTDWELIVVNDGSTDETGNILKTFARNDTRIRVLTNKKSLGIGASLNKALAHAKGAFIARMDGDDVALPKRLALQVAYLRKHRSIVAVGGQAQMIDGQDSVFAQKRFPTDPKLLREMIMWVVPMQHPIVMVRAEVYKACLYDEQLKTAEDVDWMMKLLQFGDFGNVVQTVYQYRKADTSNGYHNVKQTFWLTLLGRWRGIARYDYRPSAKGIALTIAQIVAVAFLPAKVIVRVYELKRFLWGEQYRFFARLALLTLPSQK